MLPFSRIQCLVVCSDKQHINEQQAVLIGDLEMFGARLGESLTRHFVQKITKNAPVQLMTF